MDKLTKAQRAILEAARDHGNPWKIGGAMQPWRASRAASIERLTRRGLLAYANSYGHGVPHITEAGREALGGSAAA